MRLSELRVLLCLTKVAKDETDYIYIDFENRLFVKVVDSNRDRLSTHFPSREPAVLNLLKSLQRSGYIILETQGLENYYCQLTDIGLHFKEHCLHIMLLFLYKSVAVPIVVSIITTLITLYIKGL